MSEKYILINKNISQFKIDISLEKALMKRLGSLYKFKNNYLIRDHNDFSTSIHINKEIINAILDLMPLYKINNEISKIINILSEEINGENYNLKSSIAQKVGLELLRSKVDTIILGYYEISRKFYLSEQQENLQILETTNSIGKQEYLNNAFLIDTKDIDLSKRILLSVSNFNAKDNLALAKEVFLRGLNNSQFSKYLTLERIEEIFNNIVICESQEEYHKQFLSTPEIMNAFKDIKPEEIRKTIDSISGFIDQKKSKAYLQPNVLLDALIHEALHLYSIKNGKKIGIPAAYLCLGELDKRWQISIKEISSLDEAFTEMLTRELLPEFKTENVYEFGTDFITKYYNLSRRYNKNPERFLDAYFTGDPKALASIENDISGLPISFYRKGDLWFLLLQILRNVQNLYELEKIDDNAIISSYQKQMEKIFYELEKKYAKNINHFSKLTAYIIYQEQYETEILKKKAVIAQSKSLTENQEAQSTFKF